MFDRLFLKTHAALLRAEALAETKAHEPRVFMKRHFVCLFSHEFRIYLCHLLGVHLGMAVFFDRKQTEEVHEVHFVRVNAHQDGRNENYAVVKSSKVSQRLHKGVNFSLVRLLNVC